VEESGRGEREADSPPRLLHKTTIGFSLSAEDEIFLLIIIHGKIQLVLKTEYSCWAAIANLMVANCRPYGCQLPPLRLPIAALVGCHVPPIMIIAILQDNRL